MPRKLIGQGNKITAYATTLVTGTKSKPWLVWKSDDAGLWPIEQHATKRGAENSAARWNKEEDERCQTVNAMRATRRAKKDRTPLPRSYFDDYYVRRYDK